MRGNKSTIQIKNFDKQIIKFLMSGNGKQNLQVAGIITAEDLSPIRP